MVIKRKCLYCNKNFERNLRPSWIKQSKYNKFCSRKCYFKWRKKNHILSRMFKPRLESATGYILVCPPGNHQKRILEHRVIAEKYLNRPLLPSEIIHHINGVQSDNRPENLYLFLSHSCHCKFHRKSYQLQSNII